MVASSTDQSEIFVARVDEVMVKSIINEPFPLWNIRVFPLLHIIRLRLLRLARASPLLLLDLYPQSMWCGLMFLISNISDVDALMVITTEYDKLKIEVSDLHNKVQTPNPKLLLHLFLLLTSYMSSSSTINVNLMLLSISFQSPHLPTLMTKLSIIRKALLQFHLKFLLLCERISNPLDLAEISLPAQAMPDKSSN